VSNLPPFIITNLWLLRIDFPIFLLACTWMFQYEMHNFSLSSLLGTDFRCCRRSFKKSKKHWFRMCPGAFNFHSTCIYMHHCLCLFDWCNYFLYCTEINPFKLDFVSYSVKNHWSDYIGKKRDVQIYIWMWTLSSWVSFTAFLVEWLSSSSDGYMCTWIDKTFACNVM
jgi:hypothetical protein